MKRERRIATPAPQARNDRGLCHSEERSDVRIRYMPRWGSLVAAHGGSLGMTAS